MTFDSALDADGDSEVGSDGAVANDRAASARAERASGC